MVCMNVVLIFGPAFFQHTIEASIGIFDRSWFEGKLQDHFTRRPPDNDSSWYALRNTVYAFGCRIHLNKTGSYTQAVEASLVFFRNALFVELDLLHRHSSKMSVQALALMVSLRFSPRMTTVHPFLTLPNLGIFHRRNWQSSSRVHPQLECNKLGRIKRPSSAACRALGPFSKRSPRTKLAVLEFVLFGCSDISSLRETACKSLQYLDLTLHMSSRG